MSDNFALIAMLDIIKIRETRRVLAAAGCGIFLCERSVVIMLIRLAGNYLSVIVLFDTLQDAGGGTETSPFN